MPHVEVPPPYRGPTAGEARIEVDGATVGECLKVVAERFPGFGEQIFDERGGIHRFVTLFVNGDEIRRDALETPVADGDEVKILAAIAGGRGAPSRQRSGILADLIEAPARRRGRATPRANPQGLARQEEHGR